ASSPRRPSRCRPAPASCTPCAPKPPDPPCRPTACWPPWRTAMSDKRLAELAQAVGLSIEWQDAAGQPQSVSPEAQRALLEAMGYPVQTSQQILESLATLQDRQRNRPAGPLLVAEQGQPLELPGDWAAGIPFQLHEEDSQQVHAG